MIVVVKMNSSGGNKQFKKCLIRDRVFHEVDAENRKIKNGNIDAKQIEGVISFKVDDTKFSLVKPTEWIQTAQAANFWNSH